MGIQPQYAHIYFGICTGFFNFDWSSKVFNYSMTLAIRLSKLQLLLMLDTCVTYVLFCMFIEWLLNITVVVIISTGYFCGAHGMLISIPEGSCNNIS